MKYTWRPIATAIQALSESSVSPAGSQSKSLMRFGLGRMEYSFGPIVGEQADVREISFLKDFRAKKNGLLSGDDVR